MADTLEAQLEKFEADRQKHVDAIAKLDAQIQSIRGELRGSKLADLQKQAAAYSFSPEEIFGRIGPLKQKRVATKTGKRGAAIVKYHDKTTGNTWGGGKGPVPQWIKEIRAAGGDIEKYRVIP